MNKYLAAVLFLFCLSFTATAQNRVSLTVGTAAQFKSDGCSLFPDGDYRNCCVAHDLAYFHGGKWIQRWRADGELFRCVAEKKDWWHKPLAPIMWAGVRVGGLPIFPTSFRWGFGRRKPKS